MVSAGSGSRPLSPRRNGRRNWRPHRLRPSTGVFFGQRADARPTDGQSGLDQMQVSISRSRARGRSPNSARTSPTPYPATAAGVMTPCPPDFKRPFAAPRRSLAVIVSARSSLPLSSPWPNPKPEARSKATIARVFALSCGLRRANGCRADWPGSRGNACCGM